MDNDYSNSDCAAIMTPRKTLLLGWGEKQEYAHPPKNGEPAFFISDFFLTSPRPWVQFKHVKEWVPEFASSREGAKLDWQLPKKEDFMNSVQQAVFSIKKKLFEKVVPYAFASAKHSISADLRQNLLHSAWEHANKFRGFAYGFWLGNEGMVGASPEQLFIREGNSLSTLACAGTVRTIEKENTSKLEHEHQCVVDGIIQSLSDMGNVDKAASYWRQAGNSLFHLVTPIQVSLNQNASYLEIAKRLHPTPAIGAYPKEKGAPWLAEFASHSPRWRYGAPIGYAWPDRQEEIAYVAIRNVQWNQDLWRLYAGCGVVESSNPEEEWNEWYSKFSTIRNVTNV